MTPNEWKSITDEVIGLWGSSPKWRNAEQVFRFAQTVPYSAARHAVESLFLKGENSAPAPAEVLRVARDSLDYVATADEIRRYCHTNGHLWALVDERAGVRTAVCARCGAEESGPAHRYPTESELERGDFREDRTVDTDRIAP